MENYRKGKNVEEILEKEKIPIPNLPDNFLWMHVKPGTKVRNVISYAMKAFKDERNIVWSGSGPAVEKTITCVEIMKKRYKSLHQISKIGYRKVEEFWEPQLEGLDELVVVREIPTIHILLSKDLLDTNESGYQTSRRQDNAFWKTNFGFEKTRGQGNSQTEQKNQKPKKDEQARQRKCVEPNVEYANLQTVPKLLVTPKDSQNA
ncbi:hypothetical protein B566_EDAN003639 [Ephemera danica]|nr:hypothetical protein B566_EDAN003639 [Ephemera danica]